MSAPFRLFAPDKEPPLTNRQAVALYLAECELRAQADTYSAKSLDRAQRYLRSFVDFIIDGAAIGDREAGVGRNADLTQWLVANPQWKATSQKQGVCAQVVACFHWLDGEGYCHNPYHQPKFLGPPMQPRPAITPLEYRTMMQLARKARTKTGRLRRTRWPFRAAMLFLGRTGARPCEMRDILIDQHVDLARNVIELDKHKTYNKTGKSRLIPIRRLLPLVRWLLRRRRPGQKHLFANTLGRGWSCGVFAKEFRRYAQLAGVRDSVSAYCLRHGFTVRMIERGKSDRQIADLLGQDTTRYVSWYGRQSRSQADYLNDLLDD